MARTARTRSMKTEETIIETSTAMPESDAISVEEVVVETEKVDPVVSTKVAPKKFNDNDMIDCLSITQGELIMKGQRTGLMYSWVNSGDIVAVQYNDLMYAIRSRSALVYKPRFVIMDNDFLQANKEIERIYGDMYTVEDMRNILAMPENRMISTIKNLPEGVQDSFKNFVATEIDDGFFDSAKKVKAIDALFGTNLLMKLM